MGCPAALFMAVECSFPAHTAQLWLTAGAAATCAAARAPCFATAAAASLASLSLRKKTLRHEAEAFRALCARQLKHMFYMKRNMLCIGFISKFLMCGLNVLWTCIYMHIRGSIVRGKNTELSSPGLNHEVPPTPDTAPNLEHKKQN